MVDFLLFIINSINFFYDVACSTKIALEWGEAFKNINDPSGRTVANVHDDAYVKA
jgi:hypothetical protein